MPRWTSSGTCHPVRTKPFRDRRFLARIAFDGVAEGGHGWRGFVNVTPEHLDGLPQVAVDALRSSPGCGQRMESGTLINPTGGRLESSAACIGSRLVQFALERARELAERFGCVGVVVDAQPGAMGFYGRLGFFELALGAGGQFSRPEPRPMFLPIGPIPGVARQESTGRSPQAIYSPS